MRVILLSVFILISLSLHADNSMERGKAKKRLHATKNLSVSGHEGQNVYEQHCAVCHRDGVAGAPKFHDDKDWQPRCKLRDLDALLLSAIKGLNAMPAKGTCLECTEADLKAAIEYMVPTHE